MSEEVKVTGPTMMAAMTALKKQYGDDALILSTEHHDGQYILHAKPNSLGSFEKPNLDDDIIHAYDTPMAAIKAVCDTCDKHQLGYSFCEAWLNELSRDFVTNPVDVTRALAATVPFNPMWLEELSPKNPVVFVGPPGSGKTVSLAKLAAMLLSKKKKIQVLTLDTIKAGAVSQLKAYMDCMNQPLKVGEEALNDWLEENSGHEYLLIDTPGVNILNQQDQNFLYQLSQRVHGPFTLILAADMNPLDAERVARNFYMLHTRSLIATRFDTTEHYGGLLSAAYTCGMPIAAYGKSPELTDGLHSLEASHMVSLMLK